MKWIIRERTASALSEHLQNLRSEIEQNNFSGAHLYEYFGYSLPDEKRMKDLEAAALRIIKAVRNGEKIIIFGHDDLDGITSTYILFNFLSRIGSRSHYYYIPNRLIEHHGIQERFIERVKRDGHSLVVTVDGGISSHAGIERLNELGCETIITDHHIVPDELPKASLIVNPKQADCPYPYDMLAGVGVTFFLVKRMAELLQETLPENYLLWTAIGSIADKVPMTGVNRILCRIALKRWFSIDDTTLMLCPGYNMVKDDYFSKMSFLTGIIKLLNNGRESDGENSALYLLLAPVYKKREIIAELLPRKGDYESNLYIVKRYIDQYLPDSDDLFYIYHDKEDKIPYSLLGWAANYITYHYKIPVLMLKDKNSDSVCEARCTDGFNLVKAFDYCSEALDQYGGHVRAAGFLTAKSKIDRLKELFAEYVEKERAAINQHRVIYVDAIIEEGELSRLPEILNRFAPYGESAPEPVFLIENYQIEKLMDNICPLSFKSYTPGISYDIVFTFKPDGKYLILDFEASQQDNAG